MRHSAASRVPLFAGFLPDSDVIYDLFKTDARQYGIYMLSIPQHRLEKNILDKGSQSMRL